VPQLLPVVHGVHEPPQSAPVSLPFLTPSVQAGAAHTLAEHTPLLQSVPALHASVAAHLAEQEPPQSTSVSSPLCVPSLHDGA
jgi:hypothetical protein